MIDAWFKTEGSPHRICGAKNRTGKGVSLERTSIFPCPLPFHHCSTIIYHLGVLQQSISGCRTKRLPRPTPATKQVCISAFAAGTTNIILKAIMD
jgi:hypothetical protein